MQIQEQLKEAGLTDNEAKVYSGLLEIGPKTASTLARRTGLHRRIIYDITDRLIKKGLISSIIENKKKVFSASHPKRILELIREKQEAIETIMPEMLAFYQQEKEKSRQETQFFKGIEGLKTIFEDQIQEAKEILILGANEKAYELMDIYFHWFDKKRQKSKIKTKIIFNKTPKRFNIPLSEIKYLPEKYSSDLAINIYGEKVSIILWKKDKPIAILIKDSEIADGYRKHFELMWKISDK